MIDAALPYLWCPVCEDTLARHGDHTLRCRRGHSFDMARQGYATLTRGRTPHAGDSSAMVEARAAFLAAGHYDFIADALAEAAAGTDGLIVDAGTGTGFYLARLLDALPDAVGVGLDVSKPALRRAARAHPRAGAVLADVWQPLPVREASLVVDVFAPRNSAEFRRILAPDGALVVVTPAADHLRDLITAYGMIGVDPRKSGRLAGSLGADFTAECAVTVRRTLHLTGSELRTLVGMTPSARHVDLDRLPDRDAEVTAAVDVTLHRPR